MAIYYTDAKIFAKVNPTGTASAASVGALMSNQDVAIRPGTRAELQDTVLGRVQAIFLPTVASVTSGSVVVFRQSASGVYTTAVVPNTANQAQSIAVSLHTGAANNYGWFALAGTVKVKKTATKVTPNVAMYVSATTGRLMATAASGKQVLGMRASPTATVASATSTVTVTMNHPHLQGAIV